MGARCQVDVNHWGETVRSTVAGSPAWIRTQGHGMRAEWFIGSGNRERANVGRTACVGRIKDILLDCKTQKIAQLLVNDLKNFEAGTPHDELTWIDIQVHACKLLNATGNIFRMDRL